MNRQMDGWMERFGGGVNRMQCGMVGWDGLGLIGMGWVMGGEDVKSGWVGLGWDWAQAIVCGVCYYRNLLQMQHFHPEPRPRLVMTNFADNTC